MDLDDDDRDSGFEEVGSDIDPDEMAEWLNNNQSISTGLLPKEIKVRKYLSPGTVRDLDEHYQSTQALLGSPSVSCFGYEKSLKLHREWNPQAPLSPSKT